MTHDVVRNVQELGPKLAALADENERLGQLSDETVALIRQAGVMRLLQPAAHGGYEAHPRDFAEAVMAVARQDGAAGWVCGVVGVHPWEIAQMDPQVGGEVWEDGPDVWLASPYIPGGVAEPADGGYVLRGRWPFSSGTDHCDWVFLGAVVGDGSGTGRPANPPQVLHVVLPRADYQIIPDTWNVIGLVGTGSKDVVVDGAFIPTHRTIDQMNVTGGQAATALGLSQPLYKLPFSTMFPLGITAAVVGIAEGALDAHLALQKDRVAITGVKQKDDPYALYAAGEAAAEIAASRTQLIDGVSRLFDKSAAGEEITLADRAAVRRNQVRCAWRAVSAVDELLPRSGGNAIRRDNPLQRFWRDAHVGLQHMIHVPGAAYHASPLLDMDLPLPESMTLVV